MGAHANSATSRVASRSLRGSLDHMRLWTRGLSADGQGRRSPTLDQPQLRYALDEGAGELSGNSGAATGAALHLGQNPDGLHFFTEIQTGDMARYTAPVWAPSTQWPLPLNASSSARGAPIVRTHRPGLATNVSLYASSSTIDRVNRKSARPRPIAAERCGSGRWCRNAERHS
eukprot:6174520-Prymnesium_polylepis.2